VLAARRVLGDPSDVVTRGPLVFLASRYAGLEILDARCLGLP